MSPEQKQVRNISIPGWRSIISMPKGPKPTRAQYRAYYAARRSKLRPELPEDVVGEIERRMDMREKIKTSTMPTVAQGWARVMTWVDDTQDLFSLLTFGGRLAIRWLPKILGRFIPYLGWVLLASDILRLLTLLGGIIQPFWITHCLGFSKGAASVIPSLVMGNAAKLIGHRLTGNNPFGRLARLKRAKKFVGKLFRVGEFIEMAQALKTITGYGLTLGSLMGAVGEAAYGAELAIRGEPVSIRVQGGASIALNHSDGGAYAPGSPGGLSKIYRAYGQMLASPEARAQANARADALEGIGE